LVEPVVSAVSCPEEEISPTSVEDEVHVALAADDVPSVYVAVSV
jgi:hypothetical protein